MDKVHQFDSLHIKMVETNAHAAKTEGWNLVLVKQNNEQEKVISELKQEISDLVEKECNDSKLQKMITKLED